jgi:hypothetical protein
MPNVEIVMSKANNQTAAVGDVYEVMLGGKDKIVRTDIFVRQSGENPVGELSAGDYYYRFKIVGVGGKYALSAREVSHTVAFQEEDFDTSATGFSRQIFDFTVAAK